MSRFGTFQIDIDGLIGFSLLYLALHILLCVQLYFIYGKKRQLDRAEKAFLGAMNLSNEDNISNGGGANVVVLGGEKLEKLNTETNVLYI